MNVRLLIQSNAEVLSPSMTQTRVTINLTEWGKKELKMSIVSFNLKLKPGYAKLG